MQDPNRWIALTSLSTASLLIVIDTSVVNVALPEIGADLGFWEAFPSWVVNAYSLTYGWFLLLGGRAGDLFGQRLIFLAGIGSFTIASLACWLATACEWRLVVSRRFLFEGAVRVY